MPLPLPRLNDDLPLGLGYAKPGRGQPRSLQAETRLEALYDSLDGEDWSPIPNRPGWERNGKNQLRFSPDLEKLGPRKGPLPPAAKNTATPQKAIFTPGDLCRTLSDPAVMTFERVRPLHAMYGGEYDTSEGIFNQKDPKEKLYHCNLNGWIPFDPNNFPGVMEVEYIIIGRTDERPFQVKMAPDVTPEIWARQAKAGVTKWKPVL